MAARIKKKVADGTYFTIQFGKTLFFMKQAVCRFEPSCSVYARDAIISMPVLMAIPKIIWRVVRCNPFSRGGYDPVLRDNNAMKGEKSE